MSDKSNLSKNVSLNKGYYKKLFRFRWLIFSFAAIILLFSFYSASKIKFNEDIMDLLPSDDPIIKQYKQIIQNFKLTDLMYIKVGFKDSAAPTNEDILIESADFIAGEIASSSFFKQLIYKQELKDFLGIISFLKKFRASYFTEADAEHYTNILNAASIHNILSNWKKMLTESPQPGLSAQIKTDPLGFDELLFRKLETLKFNQESIKISNSRIFSKDMMNILIMAQPIYPATDSFHAKELIEFVEQLKVRVKEKYKDKIEIQYLSGHRFALVNSLRIKSDLKIIIFVSVAAIAVLCMLSFSRPILILLTFLPAFFGGAIAVGAIKWLIPDISAISLGCGTIIIGICVDYGIHILYHADFLTEETAWHEKLSDIFRQLAKPLLLAAGTTITAFLILRFSMLPIYKDLGALAAIGVFGSLLFSLFVLPFFIPKPKSKSISSPILNFTLMYKKYFSYVSKIKAGLFFAFLIITLFALLGISYLRFEGNIQKLNYVTPEIQKDWDDILLSFGDAMGSTYLVVSADNPDVAFQNNELLLQKLNNFKATGKLQSFSSIAPIFPSLKTQNENILRWKNFWAKEKRQKLEKDLQAVSENIGINTRVFNEFLESLSSDKQGFNYEDISSLTLNNIFSNQINGSGGQTFILTNVRLTNHDDYEKIFKKLQADVPNLIGFNGKFFMEHIITMIYDELLKLGMIVFIVNIIFLLITTRSIRIVITIVIPLFISLVWTFGLMGWLGININIMNSIIVIFIFGLVDDYSIFLAQAWRSKLNTEDNYLLCSSGGITISALTTLAGFAALTAAKYPPFFSLGITACVGIVCGMLSVFILIPLFSKRDLQKK